MFHVTLLSCLLLSQTVYGAFDLGFGSDDDVVRFVTRPELRPPRYLVSKHHAGEITPGYWFVAPYVKLDQEAFPASYLQPCQAGPAIYDGDGELVWSGACMFKNQNICDFRPFQANDTQYLSAIRSPSSTMDRLGSGIILDNGMSVQQKHETMPVAYPFNMHEFKVLPGDQSALHILQKFELADTRNLTAGKLAVGFVCNMGFREFDLTTGETRFEWWAGEDIPVASTRIAASNTLAGPFPQCFDWLHLNAVDKNADGDFLITGRYTDTVYKISGATREIMWKLGGSETDFLLDGFTLTGPHDARFQGSDDQKEYISFLDNGGDDIRELAQHSTAYVIELDKSARPWTARVVTAWPRPDGGRTKSRGNLQILPNGHAFTGWADNGYVSEHSPDGRLLMEAKFASERFVNYRAYKFNFTSQPTELPVLRAFAYGDHPSVGSSVLYVSWNGATDVASYDFRNANTSQLIGSSPRTGFETSFSYSHAFSNWIYVDVIMKNGSLGARSDVVELEKPSGWVIEDDGLQRRSDVCLVPRR